MLLKCARNSFVDLLTSSAQQVVISNIAHQCMFEAIARFARPALGKRQPGIDETGNSRRKVTRGSRSHRLQERIRKLLPNHGRDLSDLFRRSEPIKPRHQRILQSSRHSRPIRCRRFDDRFGQFFDKKWDPIGFGRDVFDHIWPKHASRGDAGD